MKFPENELNQFTYTGTFSAHETKTVDLIGILGFKCARE